MDTILLRLWLFLIAHQSRSVRRGKREREREEKKKKKKKEKRKKNEISDWATQNWLKRLEIEKLFLEVNHGKNPSIIDNDLKHKIKERPVTNSQKSLEELRSLKDRISIYLSNPFNMNKMWQKPFLKRSKGGVLLKVFFLLDWLPYQGRVDIPLKK